MIFWRIVKILPNYYLRRTAKVIFSFNLCWFVRLSVSNIAGKRLKGFSWNFQDMSGMIHGTFWNILGMLRLTPWWQGFFFYVFLRKPVSVSNITGKLMNGFPWNFQQRLGLRQGTIWNIFGMLQLTPSIQDQFFYFLDSCLVVILWKTAERIFMKFS